MITAGWGIPSAFSETMLAVMVVLFAGTTMDAGLRLQRYIVQEWGNIYNIKPLKNNYISTLLSIAACLTLAFGVSAGGYPGDGGMLIWPVFGATNQILASMTLMVISIYLIKLGRPVKNILIPMIFILVFALWASGWYVIEHFRTEAWVLVFIEVAVMIATLIIILEAWSVVSKVKKGDITTEEAAVSGD